MTKKLTIEHRKKIANSLKGNKNSLGGKAATGYKHTEEWKKQASLRMIKENRRRLDMGICPTWKGGITPINAKIRNSLEYKLWREAVFKRDNYTCVWCGVKEYVQADHIKPFAYYPELRFAIDNGRTLCIPCHKTTDTFGGKNKSIIQ